MAVVKSVDCNDNDAPPVSVQEAGRSLLSAFEDLACSEALTRALVCQRTERIEKARFWVDVYLFVSTEASI